VFFGAALLIIFQPEIRRALAELGKQPMLPGPAGRTPPVDSIVAAVAALAEHRVGALIAIEREIGTRAVQATGVRMEPRVVRLTFDREIETTFAVAKPQTVGTPLMGRVEVEYEPAEVRIRGPKRRLEDLLRYGNGCVSTEPVAEQQHGQRTQRG